MLDGLLTLLAGFWLPARDALEAGLSAAALDAGFLLAGLVLAGFAAFDAGLVALEAGLVAFDAGFLLSGLA